MTILRAVLRRVSPLTVTAFAAVAAIALVAAAVIAFSSGSTAGERVGCTERATRPPRGQAGDHLNRAYFFANESPRDRDLRQIVRDGAILVRYRPILAAQDRRALRNFVVNVRRRWVIAAPDRDQSEAVKAVVAIRTLRCSDFRLDMLRSFRDKWIAQVERNGGSIAGLQAAAAGKRANALGKKGRTIRITARDLPAGDWPLTVGQGQLRCQGEGAVIFRGPDGIDYGVTRLAVDGGLPPLNSLWKDKPRHPGTSMNITPLLDRGLALCDPPLGTLAATKRYAREQLRKARDRR